MRTDRWVSSRSSRRLIVVPAMQQNTRGAELTRLLQSVIFMALDIDQPMVMGSAIRCKSGEVDVNVEPLGPGSERSGW